MRDRIPAVVGARAPLSLWRTRLGALWLVMLAGACRGGAGSATPPPMPPAEVYDTPPDFGGTWAGEVAAVEGTLDISPLGRGIYRGVYRGQNVDVEYILKLEQTILEASASTAAQPTNRSTFTWQDGRGGRGTGWLMINRGSTALTGAFGEGAGHTGGTWTFLRKS